MAADDREYDLMLLSSLTVLSTVMPGVSGMLKKQLYKPPFYTLIIGPSGSGKGCINVVRKLADPWQDYIFDISKAKVKEYEEQKELSDNYRRRYVPRKERSRQDLLRKSRYRSVRNVCI